MYSLVNTHTPITNKNKKIKIKIFLYFFISNKLIPVHISKALDKVVPFVINKDTPTHTPESDQFAAVCKLKIKIIHEAQYYT